jgi:peptidoglycan/xylan/chitin deacetylase (PgdA/CDA1 family)
MRRTALALLVVGGLLTLPAAALAEDLGIVISSPSEGAVVGGVVEMSARTTGPVVAVTFDVSPDASSWTVVATDAAAGDGWTASWDSAGWNGPAWIRATASDGTSTASARVLVTVDQASSLSVGLTDPAFSPNGDGRAERTRIQITLGRAAALTVRIEGPDGTVARLLDTAPVPAGSTNVLWDGRRASGRIVPDGRYLVRVEAVDETGVLRTAEATVIVDTRAPTFAWRSISPEPFLGIGSVRFRFRTHDRASTILVRGRVTDVGGGTVASLPPRRVAGGLRRMTWDGRAGDDEPPTPGLMHVAITVRDDAGNVWTSEPRPFRDHHPVVPEVIRRVDGAGRRVALTFDDCYDASAWARILGVLEARDAGGSFFCLGPYVRAHPELARRVVADGLTIGGHGWDHTDVTTLDAGGIAARLRLEAAAWWDTTTTTPVPYFRPPGGELDADATRAIGDEGFATIVLWDVDPWDWSRPGSAAVTSRVLSHVRAGSIVVLHAIPGTASALPGIIAGLRDRGLEPVTLDELLAGRDP